jgi:hypothetical protein
METTKNQSIETSLRQLRIIHAAMLFSIVLYAFISLRAPARPVPPPTVLYAFMFVTLADVGLILVLRNKLLASSGPLSSGQSDDSLVIARWRSACIITWALCESIALFGLVLRYMGFAMTQAMIFFVAGFVLMALFAPRRPLTTSPQ